jgi:hypothetical protein
MNSYFRTLLLLGVITLSACKTTSSTSDGKKGEAVGTTPEAAVATSPKVADRAVTRWKKIISGDLANAYEMLSPGYRQTHDKQEYVDALRNRPVQWTNASFVDQACASDDVCTVKVMIEFNIEMPSIGTVPSRDVLEEKWIQVDGSWYFLPINSASAAAAK